MPVLLYPGGMPGENYLPVRPSCPACNTVVAVISFGE